MNILKNLKKLPYFLLGCLLLTNYSCLKDENLPIDDALIENRTYSDGVPFTAYTVTTNCEQLFSGFSGYSGGPRIKTSAQNQTALNTFIARMVSSGTFEWTKTFIESFGVPYFEMALYTTGNNNVSIKLPIFNDVTNEITSFYTITESNHTFSYNFVERKFNDLFINISPNNPVLIEN